MLLVVTTNAADTAAMAEWLRPQLPDADVVTASGYYAAVSALNASPRVVVADVGAPSGRDDWRLAELRSRTAGVAVVVLADAAHVEELSGPLHADLAVTSLRRLPPLRELLVNDEPVVADPPRASRRDESSRR